jgi:hypothetical protein
MYQKAGGVYHVTVYLMEVTTTAAKWPEHRRRQRCWVTPRKAVMRLPDGGLRTIVRSLLSNGY